MRPLLLALLLATLPASAADWQVYTHSLGAQASTVDGSLRGQPHGGKRAFYVELVRALLGELGQPQSIVEVPLARNMSVASGAEAGLAEIAQADRTFQTATFLRGAQDAFVMIVEAFAAGDRDTLRMLLAEPVFKAFVSVINERESTGQKASVEIHAIRKAEIVAARPDVVAATAWLFTHEVLLKITARVKALFRRQEAMSQNLRMEAGIITVHGVEIDPLAREVRLHGKSLDLTPREFDLLYFFARHPGEVFSRQALLDQVWGYQHEGYEHTVNSHINRLRTKIEKDAAEPEIILTVWGRGYKLAAVNAEHQP